MKKETKYLVAKRNDGKYFNLIHDYGFPHTTEPSYVDSPLDAQLISVSDTNKNELEHPHCAAWYFENSRRMRKWLKGCRMVVVTEIREVKEEPIIGPSLEEDPDKTEPLS